MTRFDDLAAFAAVVRESSFTRAAAQLGISQSALSQTVQALERRLNLKLLNRTTRSVSPTEAGERLYRTVGPRFEDIEAELTVLGELRGEIAGTVRITATEHAAWTLVLPRLLPVCAKHPGVNLEVCSDNRFIDIVAERFDIGVRSSINVDKDMISVRMAPDMQMTVVGSPHYFLTFSPPQTPHDLAQHNCIRLRLPTHGGLMNWEFKRRGRSMNQQVAGRLVFNKTDLIMAAARAGHGLAWVPFDVVEQDIKAGRLLAVLEDWAVTYPGYYLYYPSRGVSPAVRLVVEALRASGSQSSKS